MNKFGLLENEAKVESAASGSFAEKLSAFPPVAPRQAIDISAMDAAAATHGFVSREAIMPPQTNGHAFAAGRRRRIATTEPTRHLAIRLTLTQYARFVAYADAHKLTYHDALVRLLEESGRA